MSYQVRKLLQNSRCKRRRTWLEFACMLSSLTSILNALAGKPLPVYGKGNQIRDWLYVEDHVRALVLVALEGKVGETYYIGGHNEKQNIEVVQTICSILPLIIQIHSLFTVFTKSQLLDEKVGVSNKTSFNEHK